jgi:hypothetical protein
METWGLLYWLKWNYMDYGKLWRIMTNVAQTTSCTDLYRQYSKLMKENLNFTNFTWRHWKIILNFFLQLKKLYILMIVTSTYKLIIMKVGYIVKCMGWFVVCIITKESCAPYQLCPPTCGPSLAPMPYFLYT